ncbi:PilN domain-containing protein [Halochromatium roseum]|uniref:PilN domain-containing protein n=1 Tax=Halochromatium roseum TaxID=391920 RepID=UPI0019117652|nr:PilN domain-containing protein [Halochromatium roseum]MBK5940590.1 pilus assembly protein PilN [Halochromatium roseum]
MARINLLPWREQERRRRQRDLGLIALAALGSVLLIAVLLKLQLDAMIDAQQARNRYLEGQITVLNRRIREINELEKKKADLLARMGVIQELQESRPEIVHLLDRLVDAVPVGVFLTQLKQEGGRITIEGRAQSNARVSALMRNIESSAWIGKPELLLIENKDETGTGFSHFRLRFEQQRLQPDADEDVIAFTVGRR